MQQQAKPSEMVQNLLNEQTQLFAELGRLTKQKADVEAKINAVSSSLQGVQLGQALLKQQQDEIDKQEETPSDPTE